MAAEAPTYTAAFIGNQVKAIMELIAEIDPYLPDEDMVEVLIGEVTTWGTIEAQALFPVLEAAFEGSESVTEPARTRLNTLYSLHGDIHIGEGAEAPFTELAVKYIKAVKYHLLADIQDMVPLAAQLPQPADSELAQQMAAMKMEIE